MRRRRAVDLVVDLDGWLTTASDVGLVPEPSRRVIDTRISLGGAARLGPGQTIQVPVIGGVSPTTAVTLNVTAVDPGAPGFVTVYPCGVVRPLVSNLNPEPGVIQPNLVNVRVGAGGSVCMFSSQETDLVVDLLAEYRPGAPARFSAVAPQRLLDSRNQNAPRHQSNLSFVVAIGSGHRGPGQRDRGERGQGRLPH